MADQDFPKSYESKEYEDAIYAAWEKSGFFNPDNLPGERKEAFSIVLPPPNVTGTLHMGHAVMLAIEDIMTRHARMSGKRALWIPGTDHAAIATQTKVEKVLIESGLKDPRHDLGRETFLEHVEKFAQESHDTIVNQMKKMGASVDWSREMYTLDEGPTKAVQTTFKMMHDDGLIYRGDRIVNWCPRCQSTLADDEVEYKESKSKFYYFKYGPLVIGTARPETKFLDKIVIVHPEDERYKELVGSEFDLEWIEGPITARVVADEAADMEMGSGAMTITPAHSLVDFDLAQKHGFEIEKIIDEDGNFTEAAGSFAGKNARASREEIVKVLQEKGLVDHIDEDYVHNLSVCYRCDTPVEPLPKLQWFIDVNKPFAMRQSNLKGIKKGQKVTLKELMRHVVETGQVRIIPERFNKTYFHWIDNLRDWNISRQIWFGHRVPVWYKGSEMTIGEEPNGDGWVQDEDTLDTWFSSGLWTLSTLGWPEETTDLKTYHPTSVLETGYDILFFWVARMILMTTYAVGDVPFRDVYLHGLVRDEKGRKMSKSLDNIIDPLDMIAQYGADATRLSLMIGGAAGQDSKLSEAKVGGFRNFTNKLWNISRFVLTSVEKVERIEKPTPTSRADKRILSRFDEVVTRVSAHMEKYEYSQAGELLREFTWGEFADWYLEISKVSRNDSVLLYIMERLLKLWHPFMPFVTEEIWKRFGAENMLIVEEWPTALGKSDAKAEKVMELVRSVISAVRNLRAQYKIEPAKKLDVIVAGKGVKVIEEEAEVVKRLARIESLVIDAKAAKPEGSGTAVVGSLSLYVPLAGVVDLKKEKKRLETELKDLESYLAKNDAKLSNNEFLKNAPEQVVAELKEKHEDAQSRAETLKTQIADL